MYSINTIYIFTFRQPISLSLEVEIVDFTDICWNWKQKWHRVGGTKFVPTLTSWITLTSFDHTPCCIVATLKPPKPGVVRISIDHKAGDNIKVKVSLILISCTRLAPSYHMPLLVRAFWPILALLICKCFNIFRVLHSRPFCSDLYNTPASALHAHSLNTSIFFAHHLSFPHWKI